MFGNDIKDQIEKMHFYFQFFTQNQSLAVLDLIRLPILLDMDQMVAGKARIAAGGRLTDSKFSSLEEFTAGLRASRFNELEVQYDIKRFRFGQSVFGVKRLNGVFYPSPTSSIWLPSREFLETDRNSRARRMNAWKDEECLKGLGVEKMPSIAELAAEVEETVSESEFLDNLAQCLATRQVPGIEIFGCCDTGGKEMFVRLEANVLPLDKIRIMAKVLPTAYPELGEKFDDLHPLMFGARHACSGLAKALGNNARLILGSNASQFAVIRLDPKCDIVAARERAKDWLLPSIR